MWGIHMVELARVLLDIMRAVTARWGSGSVAVEVGPSTGEECSVMAGWIKGEGGRTLVEVVGHAASGWLSLAYGKGRCGPGPACSRGSGAGVPGGPRSLHRVVQVS